MRRVKKNEKGISQFDPFLSKRDLTAYAANVPILSDMFSLWI